LIFAVFVWPVIWVLKGFCMASVKARLGNCPFLPPQHHQGFWRKARKYSGESKPTQG
jgi:hypothetical protein